MQQHGKWQPAKIKDQSSLSHFRCAHLRRCRRANKRRMRQEDSTQGVRVAIRVLIGSLAETAFHIPARKGAGLNDPPWIGEKNKTWKFLRTRMRISPPPPRSQSGNKKGVDLPTTGNGNLPTLCAFRYVSWLLWSYSFLVWPVLVLNWLQKQPKNIHGYIFLGSFF